MRYLLALLMCLPLCCYAQAVVLSAAGGVLNTKTVKQIAAYSKVSDGQTYGVGLDILQNNKHPFSLAYGFRMGLNHFMSYEEQVVHEPYGDRVIKNRLNYSLVSIALPLSINYKLNISPRAAIRLAAGGGPFLLIDFGKSPLSIFTEASAGMQVSDKMIFGLRYIKPFNEVGKDYPIANTYHIDSWQVYGSVLLDHKKLNTRIRGKTGLTDEQQRAEREEQRYRRKPYIDLVFNGNVLYPKPTERYKDNYNVTNAYWLQAGLDVMYNGRKRHLFPSFSMRIGYSGFKGYRPYAPGHEMYYSAFGLQYCGAGFGLNFITNPSGSFNVLTSVSGTLGFKFQRDNPSFLGMPYYLLQAGTGVRINRKVALSVKVSRTLLFAYTYAPEYSADFNAWGVGGELRLSLGRTR